jgi:hypothetical protein
MWSQPRLSVLVHGLVATGLLAIVVLIWTAKQRQAGEYNTTFYTLLAASLLNYIAAAYHLSRFVRLR